MIDSGISLRWANDGYLFLRVESSCHPIHVSLRRIVHSFQNALNFGQIRVPIIRLV